MNDLPQATWRKAQASTGTALRHLLYDIHAGTYDSPTIPRCPVGRRDARLRRP